LQGVVAAEIFAKIDAALLAEIRNGLAVMGVERVKIIRDRSEDAALLPIGPVGEATLGAVAFESGIEFPNELASGGVERDDFGICGVGLKNAADDEWAGFETAFFSGVELPGEFELTHVGAIDLRKTGVVVGSGLAAVNGPIGGLWIRLCEE
jgi:hypothetical protein